MGNDEVVLKQATKKEIIDLYNKGMHTAAIAEKLAIADVAKVINIVREAFPADQPPTVAEEAAVQEGVAPESEVSTTETEAAPAAKAPAKGK